MTWPDPKPVIYHTKQLTPILWYDLTRSRTRCLSHEAANTNSLIWPEQISNPWSITQSSKHQFYSLWYDLTRSQTRCLSHEAANTNSIVFDMTWPELKPVIYHTKQLTPILWYDLTRSRTRCLSHEAANTNSLIWPEKVSNPWSITRSSKHQFFDMTWPYLKPVIYHTKQLTPIP